MTLGSPVCSPFAAAGGRAARWARVRDRVSVRVRVYPRLACVLNVRSGGREGRTLGCHSVRDPPSAGKANHHKA